MCKVYTGYYGTSEIEHGLCACTVDNPLAKARGLSLRTGAQTMLYLSLRPIGGGRVVRWSWVNFQCRGVLLVLIRVGQGPTVLAAGAGGGCLDIFTLIYLFSPLSPSLWETTRYRLKYCLKGPLSPKTTNQLRPIKNQNGVRKLWNCILEVIPFVIFSI